RPEAFGDPSGGGLGVEGVEPRGQAGELEREIDPRDRAERRAVESWFLGRDGEPRGEPPEEFDAGGLIRLGLGVADDGLAEEVGGEADAPRSEGLDGLE